MSNVRLIWSTPDAEQMILFMARVSSPDQNSGKVGLIKYLVREEHWSPFEMANMCLEIETSRAISAQILRHRSFSFQEFSQRYAPVSNIQFPNARRQDTKNRQNSIDNLSQTDLDWWNSAVLTHWQQTQNLYDEALKRGIAKECARMVLPMSSTTKMYMNGTLRSWIHYFRVRTQEDTQMEHRVIARAAHIIFENEFPIIAKAVETYVQQKF